MRAGKPFHTSWPLAPCLDPVNSYSSFETQLNVTFLKKSSQDPKAVSARLLRPQSTLPLLNHTVALAVLPCVC